jgi:membrane-associated phospholipid phosphatase
VTEQPTSRRESDIWLAGVCGTAYIALGAWSAHSPHPRERALFRAVNRRGGAAPVLRVPQQLGTPWLLPAMAVVSWAVRRPHLAVSAGFALPVEKSLEVGLKKLVGRRRPARVLETRLRDDAPVDGPSYPSGHAAIAMCGATLLAPYLSVPTTLTLAVTAGVTACTRVHQGAHFPLDAVGGLLLGLGTGSLLTYTFGLPVSSGRPVGP